MGTTGHNLDTFNIADLTPEQQRILIEIRRRKTELLLEIQVLHFCLGSTGSYFQWEGNFYEQLDGVTMGSPLSPVLANFFLERFEKKAIDAFDFKPIMWLQYVEDFMKEFATEGPLLVPI